MKNSPFSFHCVFQTPTCNFIPTLIVRNCFIFPLSLLKGLYFCIAFLICVSIYSFTKWCKFPPLMKACLCVFFLYTLYLFAFQNMHCALHKHDFSHKPCEYASSKGEVCFFCRMCLGRCKNCTFIQSFKSIFLKPSLDLRIVGLKFLTALRPALVCRTNL